MIEIEKTYERHESYGLMTIRRTISNKAIDLFGSSIKHNNTIKITIRNAEKERHLNRNFYFGRKQLIEVEMSPVQFSEMITCLNVGEGTPCTIRYIKDHGEIENPPEVNQREIFEEEFQNDIKEIKKFYSQDYQEIKNILNKKGNITVGDRQDINSKITSLIKIIEDNIPFVQSSFNEAMDKTIMESKGEVEAFVMNKIHSVGLNNIDKLQITE